MKKSKSLGVLQFSKSAINLDDVQRVRAQIRAIDHGLRSGILKHLDKVGKSNVSDIFRKFKIEQAVASQQLGILRKAMLVETTRSGKQVIYSLNHGEVNALNARVQSVGGR